MSPGSPGSPSKPRSPWGGGGGREMSPRCHRGHHLGEVGGGTPRDAPRDQPGQTGINRDQLGSTGVNRDPGCAGISRDLGCAGISPTEGPPTRVGVPRCPPPTPPIPPHPTESVLRSRLASHGIPVSRSAVGVRLPARCGGSPAALPRDTGGHPRVLRVPHHWGGGLGGGNTDTPQSYHGGTAAVTLTPGSPGIPRAPSAPGRPCGTQRG